MSLQDEIASIANVVTGFLLDQATNSRTGAVTPCSIALDTSYVRFSPAVELLRLPRWILTLPDATDDKVGDILTVTNPTTGISKGQYLLVELASPNTYSISIDTYAVALPTPITANVKRGGSYLFSGSMVNLWPFLGMLMRPISSEFVQSQFDDADVTQPYLIYTQWPAGASGDNVVQGGDFLVIGSTNYRIIGVRPFPPSYIELYIQVRQSK